LPRKPLEPAELQEGESGRREQPLDERAGQARESGREPPGKPAETRDDWCGVGLLSACWACAFSTLTVAIATIALAGMPFAPGAGAHTLPLACVFYSMGLANAAIPAEVRRLGRQGAYILGAALGVAGCGVCAVAIVIESFVVLCLGGALLGMGIAHAQNYRFAAVLLAGSNPPKAIAWVTAGGVLGAILGPGILARAKLLFPTEFTGIYVLGMGVHVVALLLLLRVKFPGSLPAAAGGPGAGGAAASRHLARIFLQPRSWAASYAMLVAYIAMSLIMVPAPLVMPRDFGHSYDVTTIVMMCHMVLMFAPSLGTGACIGSCGTVPVMMAGCAANFLSAVVLWMGSSLLCFFVGLAFLGVGWNFLFLAGTSQLASSYRPAEGPKVQALNDGLVFMVSGTASLISAPMVESLGWGTVQVVVMGLVLVSMAIVAIPPLREGVAGRKARDLQGR